MPRRLLVALFAALALLPAAPADAQGQKLVKTSATLTYKEIQQHPNGCLWGIGVVVGPVPGAKSYLVKYWDGYYKQLEVATATKEQLSSDPNWPGVLVQGITGGSSSTDCGGGGEPTEGGRFSKGAKAWAIFPGKHKKKPFLNVVVKTPPPVAVGATPKVTVTVVNGEVALKDVKVTGLTGGGAVASVTHKPSGASGFSLAANARKSFVYTVKAQLPGIAALGAKATGKAKKGSASGHGSGQLFVSRSDVVLTTRVKEAQTRLDVDKDGKVQPKTVTVVAQVTNTSDTDIDNVSIQSLNPVPVKKGQRLDQIAIAGGQLPIEVGKLAAGASSQEYELPLEVTGDGKYKINGLALYAASDGGTGKTVAESQPFEITVPPLWLKFDLDPQNIKTIGGQPWIDAGRSWYVNGKLINVSDYKRLCLSPLLPHLTGNAAANGPINIQEKNAGLRQAGGPFGGAVEPNHDALLQMYVDTAAGGGTVSVVQFKPEAGVLKDEEQKCTDKTYKGLTKLGAQDVTLGSEKGVVGVRVDVSTPVKEPNPVGFAGNLLLGIGRNLAVDTVKQALDLVALGRNQWSIESQYAGLLPYGTATAFRFTVRSAQAIGVASSVYWNWLKEASAKQKGAIFATAGQFLADAGNGFYTEATQLVRDAAQPWLNKLQKAYETGDDAELGYLWGQVGGSVLQQVLMGEFLKVAGGAIAADSAQLERQLVSETETWTGKEAAAALEAEGQSATKAAIAEETVPSGAVLDLAEKSGVWGIDSLTDRLLKKIAAKWKVVIGVRSRAAGSIKKLLNGSVWKHENLKPKNVSPIDIDYLGFKPEHLDDVHFRTYTDEQVAAITNRIQDSNLTPHQKLLVFDRFETRLNEGPKFLKKIQGYSQRGEIDVGFNYRENGINKATTKNVRRFQLDGSEAGQIGEVPPGGEYYTPYQENLDLYNLRKSGTLPENCKRLLKSVLCKVTGDVDGVYVTNVDGTNVDPEDLIKIYAELADAGWQHPETLTWVDQIGNFLFAAKENILKEFGEGGKALVEYGPDGVTRATRIAFKRSKLTGSGSYRLERIGGYEDALVR